MASFDELVNTLSDMSRTKKDEIEKLVEKKHSEMKDLITKEGSVYLVARDLGINMPDNFRGGLQIKNIVSGMRNVNVVGRIFRISKIIEFKKSNGSTGRVSNVFIGDYTGFVRIPLWNEQLNVLDEDIVSLGDVVQISNGMTKDNIYGDVEISLGRFGTINVIENPEGFPTTDELTKSFFGNTSERTSIIDATPGGSFEIKGTIVQLFKSRFLFTVCPVCENKIENNRCEAHGEVTPSHAMVLSFIVDDGTENLRCVLFRDLAEKLCGMPADALSTVDENIRYEKIKNEIVGKEMVFLGRVKRNNVTDRLEMIVNDFKGINPLEESKKLVDELELMVGG